MLAHSISLCIYMKIYIFSHTYACIDRNRTTQIYIYVIFLSYICISFYRVDGMGGRVFALGDCAGDSLYVYVNK